MIKLERVAHVHILGNAAWLVGGNMFGAGIFVPPGLVAGYLPGAIWPMAAWVLGGVLALFGASTYVEPGARVPHTAAELIDARFPSGVIGEQRGGMRLRCMPVWKLLDSCGLRLEPRTRGLERIGRLS